MNRRQLFTRGAAVGATALVGGGLAQLGRAESAKAQPSDQLPGRADIVASMNLVDDYWIANNDLGGNEWTWATYYSGLMHHFRTTQDQQYLDHAVAWAESHAYGLKGGDTTRHADNQCAGQTYLDLYEELGGDEKIAHIDASVSAMVAELGANNEDWWWCDALHMAMPVFTRLGDLHGDTNYWVKMYRLYHYCKRQRGGTPFVKPGNLSESVALWYRDEKFQVDGSVSTSPNGLPVLWSRGNGWVIGAHAKTLKVIPHNDKRGPEYVYMLQQMAAALADTQQPDGFWYPNLTDPDHVNTPETSGTAFFVFGIAYGINAGLLDRATYEPVVARGWNAMVETAVRDDGFLGHCQAPGDRPGPAPADHTETYGVGAFLMAGSELAELVGA